MDSAARETKGAERAIRQRTCIGCGAVAQRSSLARIVRTPEGAVYCDAGQKAAGRGAYVCGSRCLAGAVKKRKLDRALRTTLASDQIATIAASVEALGLDARK